LKVLCFTSFTFSYLNRARVLFQSVRRFHPDWHLVALFTDKPPEGLRFSIADEPFDEVVWETDLGIPNLKSWLFRHDIVEVCTAVKGPYIEMACQLGFDAVVYLDPDTCVFNSLDPLLGLLEHSDIILTPHILRPEDTRMAVIDNEICPLWAGTYNLGFVAIRTTGAGAQFANWWSDRLSSFCYDDVSKGLFVDQKWCDLVPALFDNVHILRDPGYNVASWNLNQRRISVDLDGQFFVNGVPLRFWHFTKLGPVGDTMTRRYAGDNFPVYELWRWYRKQIKDNTSSAIPDRYWAYGHFDNGEKIHRSYRLLYRDRTDLQEAFPDPYATSGNSLWSWLGGEGLRVET
jgi:hypothetical protein